MRPDPVFILGAHKSGTSLLRNLLDGHDQLFALPFESHFFQYYGYWVTNNYRYSKPVSYGTDEWIKVFTDFIQANNESDDKLGDAFVYGKLNTAAFKSVFKNLNEQHTIAEAFNLFIDGSHQALFGEPLEENKIWVEKSVEHAEFALDIRKAFPNSKFIHVVRNPYSNLVSLRKYKSLGFGYPLIHRVLQTLENSYYHLERNQRLLDNYKVIRYEDLVASPNERMKEIAEFIGVEFNASLLSPTSLGNDWSGNSTTGNKFSGVSAENLERWKHDIQPMEAEYVNRQFDFVLRKYDYPEFRSDGGFWKHCAGESAKRYLANRFYKFYSAGWV